MADPTLATRVHLAHQRARRLARVAYTTAFALEKAEEAHREASLALTAATTEWLSLRRQLENNNNA